MVLLLKFDEQQFVYIGDEISSDKVRARENGVID